MSRDQLTPNFNEAEFFIHEAPPESIRVNKLPKVAALCQWLRDLAGSPGIVASYYRSPTRNASVGGVKDSQHMVGEAADLSFPAISLRELARRVQSNIDAGSAPEFGQVIFYPDTGETHVSLPGATKYRELAIGLRSGGTRHYSVLASLDQLPSVPKGLAVLAIASVAGTVAAFFFPALYLLRG